MVAYGAHCRQPEAAFQRQAPAEECDHGHGTKVLSEDDEFAQAADSKSSTATRDAAIRYGCFLWDYGNIIAMGRNTQGVTYKGFSTGEGWEVTVKRPGQALRLLDLPLRKGEWALRILTDYLGDEGRAADLQQDFAALTIRRFTADWELRETDIDNALTEVEILRARLRIALARG